MSRDVHDKMHGGCNFENNLNQAQSCEFQIAFASCGVNFQNIVLSSISVDFTYFLSLARELSLQSWLTFRENGPQVLSNQKSNLS